MLDQNKGTINDKLEFNIPTEDVEEEIDLSLEND